LLIICLFVQSSHWTLLGCQTFRKRPPKSAKVRQSPPNGTA